MEVCYEANSLTITGDWLDFKQPEQIILYFINPIFPRGFAQLVANTHDNFELQEMEQLKINRINGNEIII